MAYLYEEIVARVEAELRPTTGSGSRVVGFGPLDQSQAKRLGEKDNRDLILIDEIEKSGFLQQLYRQ